MKLLFDQNLSHRLVNALATEFPESTHIRHIGMDQWADGPVWEYAKVNGFVIVSKDSDFHHLSAREASTPERKDYEENSEY